MLDPSEIYEVDAQVADRLAELSTHLPDGGPVLVIGRHSRSVPRFARARLLTASCWHGAASVRSLCGSRLLLCTLRDSKPGCCQGTDFIRCVPMLVVVVLDPSRLRAP